MICVHLKELYSLCEKHELRLGGSDLIRIICRQCELEETCPSVLLEEYEAAHPEAGEESADEYSPIERARRSVDDDVPHR